MPLTSGVSHVATLTADLDRTLRFDAEAFGAEKSFEMAATDDHRGWPSSGSAAGPR